MLRRVIEPGTRTTSVDAVGDLATAEALDAMARPGCPLCSVITTHERRYIESFWPATRNDRQLQERFAEAGGFCARHAWDIHRHLAGRKESPAIADLYGRLIAHDLLEIKGILDGHARRRRGPRGIHWPERPRRCPACDDRDRALERKAAFLVLTLDDAEARRRYAISDGPCAPHLRTLLEAAAAEGGGTAHFLLEDWRDRLERLSFDLSEYRRKRDVRYQREPRGAEEGSWTAVIRRYAGSEPRAPRDG